MDVARSCSKRDARFFFDDGRSITLRWYRAPSNAKTFPTQHKWGHLTWYTSPWMATGVGEVYDSPDRYFHGFTPPTACGDAFFGNLSDFQNGASFDPATNVNRDVWGIPVACGCQPDRFLLLEAAYKPLLLQEDGFAILLEP